MGNITVRDAEEILQMFEKEQNTIQGLARIEKMKLRKKIVNTLRPVLLEKGQNAKVIRNSGNSCACICAYNDVIIILIGANLTNS